MLLLWATECDCIKILLSLDLSSWCNDPFDIGTDTSSSALLRDVHHLKLKRELIEDYYFLLFEFCHFCLKIYIVNRFNTFMTQKTDTLLLMLWRNFYTRKKTNHIAWKKWKWQRGGKKRTNNMYNIGQQCWFFHNPRKISPAYFLCFYQNILYYHVALMEFSSLTLLRILTDFRTRNINFTSLEGRKKISNDNFGFFK